MKKRIVTTAALLFAFSVSAPAHAASEPITFDFDDSDPSVELTTPFQQTSLAFEISVTSNQGVYISGDANNGDIGVWSLIAPSGPNLMKIWDNADISLNQPSSGWDVACSTGDTGGPSVTLTITSYFEGNIVEGPRIVALGALNEWQTISSSVAGLVDRINIEGRDSTMSTQPFGCDDLVLYEESATTTTEVTTTTTDVVTTQASSENTLVKTGADGSRGAQAAILLLALGAIALVFTRRQARVASK